MKNNIYMHNWITLLCTRNEHKTLSQLHINKINFLKMSSHRKVTEKALQCPPPKNPVPIPGLWSRHKQLLGREKKNLWVKRLTSCPLLLFSHSVMSDSLQSHGLQHARLPCPSLPLRVCSNSCHLSHWCHPTISSSVDRFSSCLQSFPALGSFLTNWLFTSGGQNMRASASASVLPVNIQGWVPLGLTALISLLSMVFSRVISK